MFSAAFLDYGKRLPHLAGRFEVSKQKDGVHQIADIDWRIDVCYYEPMLCDGHQRCNSFLAQVRQQFVELHCQALLARHCIQKAIQAVYNQQPQIVLFNQLANLIDELTG